MEAWGAGRVGSRAGLTRYLGGGDCSCPGSQKLARKFRNTVLEIRVTFKMISSGRFVLQ